MSNKDVNSYKTCSKCGKLMNSESVVDVDGKIVCKGCVSAAMEAPHKPRAVYESYTPPTGGKVYGKKYCSKFLTFCLSALPGLNYMYLGLIRRGIFVMLSFFASIYLTSLSHWNALPAVAILLVVFFASLFDSLNIAKRMNNGIEVTDSFDDIIDTIKKNKVIAIMATIFIFLNIALSSVSRFLPYEITRMFGSLPVILFIVFIVYLIMPSTNRRDKDNDKDIIDRRDQ